LRAQRCLLVVAKLGGQVGPSVGECSGRGTGLFRDRFPGCIRCTWAGSTLEGKLNLCYGSMGRSGCNKVSRVEVATTHGWTSRAKSSDADLEQQREYSLEFEATELIANKVKLKA
jgi:hypothetical protein